MSETQSPADASHRYSTKAIRRPSGDHTGEERISAR
jgi:hypothetical protein